MVSINRVLLFLWTFLLLNFRPSILAQTYNKVIFALFLIVTLIILIVLHQKERFVILRKEFILLGSLFTTFCYFLIQGLTLSSNISPVINSCVLMAGTIPCIFLIVRRFENKTLVIRYIIDIHFWLSISQIVTFVFFVYTGFKLYELPIYSSLQEVAKYHFGNNVNLIHNLAFPFTIIWSNFLFGGIEFYRTCGMYREPGMAQIFYLTAFFMSFFYVDRNMGAKRIVILVGSLLLFSASGFINLAIGFVFYFVLNKIRSTKMHRNVLIQLGVASVVLFIFAVFTAIVVIRKFEVESGFERIVNIQNSLNGLMKKPFFGEGYYNDFNMDKNGQVTSEVFLSFVGVLNQLGGIGTLLYLISWGISLRYFANRYSLCLYLPCLLTLLTSQPSYNDIFVWFLILLNTSTFYHADTSHDVLNSDPRI